MAVMLIPSVVKDYLPLLQKRLLAPLYAWGEELSQVKNCREDHTKCVQGLQSLVRVTLSAGLTFGYWYAWKFGEHHLGPLGGLGAFTVVYQLGKSMDPRINYISSSTWLFYQGVSGILKHSGTHLWDSVCLLLLTYRETKEFPPAKIFQSALMDKGMNWLAEKICPKTETVNGPEGKS